MTYTPPPGVEPSERIAALLVIGKLDVVVDELLRENARYRNALRAIAAIQASGPELRVWRIATKALAGEADFSPAERGETSG